MEFIFRHGQFRINLHGLQLIISISLKIPHLEYQENTQDESSKERIFDRKRNLKDVYDDCEMPILNCNEPKPKKNTRHDVTLNEAI